MNYGESLGGMPSWRFTDSLSVATAWVAKVSGLGGGCARSCGGRHQPCGLERCSSVIFGKHPSGSCATTATLWMIALTASLRKRVSLGVSYCRHLGASLPVRLIFNPHPVV